MRILLTGGAGYIGSHTALDLARSGHTVISVDNYSNSSPVALERVSELAGKEIRQYEADVRDREKLLEIFREEKPEAVIHFAGLKAVGESVEKPLEYYSNNLNATITLLSCMKECGIRIIVFSSSATVYGDPEKLPLTEDCKTGPCSNPYG